MATAARLAADEGAAVDVHPPLHLRATSWGCFVFDDEARIK